MIQTNCPRSLLPPDRYNPQGKTRRIGIEIELAGLDPKTIVDCLQSLYGGQVEQLSLFEYTIATEKLGKFRLELDAGYLKKIGKQFDSPPNSGNHSEIEQLSAELLTTAAEQLVPWEIVTAPVPLTDLPKLLSLIDDLRNAGAKGTRHAIHYAFGMHFNPELPALNADTILAYLRAYFCLYDWIVQQEQIDVTRRLTPYINHFDKHYINTVIELSYQPKLPALIDDYLAANPSRNRSLDMLPLFAYLDEPRVRNAIDDPRIKARPTLHYRLPNCDIDNPKWNLDKSWRNWLQVEYLAHDRERLQQLCRLYQRDLQRLARVVNSRWPQAVESWLVDL